MKTITAITLLELVFLVGTILHLHYFNGSPYWQWDWRDLGYLRTTFYFMPPLMLYVWALHKTQTLKGEKEAYQILAMIMVSNFLFQVMGMAVEPFSLDLLKSIIVSRRTTSYFYDASHIRDITAFLKDFHLLDLRAHSSTHPPGLIVYFYLLIQLFGPDAGAYVGGSLIAFMASAGVLVLYLFSSLWTGEVKPRLTICAYYALIPGLVLFFPTFDQTYPIFSMLMIYFWEISLRRSRYCAIYLGLILFMASFFAYNLLVIGAFHLLSAIAFLLAGKNTAGRFRVIISVSLLAIGTTVACYLALFWAAGFDPILSFKRALDANSYILSVLERPYRFYVFYNFYEFFLSSGIIVAPLLAAYILRTVKEREFAQEQVLSYLGLLAIVIVDLTGLLRSEAARLWLFLQPLVLMPAGLELMRLTGAQRRAVFLLLWVNVVVIKANMVFFIP